MCISNVVIDLSSSPVLVFDRNYAVLGGAVYLVYSLNSEHNL